MIESTILKATDADRRLLVAFAHPDDESFGPAGTIVRYTSHGVAVHYVCATRGEVGHADPELLAGYDSVAELRMAELECAAGHLGLSGVHLLGYHDSGMENTPENQNPDCLFQAPMEEVVGRITRLIRGIRPQVVLTFDATGGYFHPDHVKMHQATTLAFHAAGDPERFPGQLDGGLPAHQPQKLYYTVFPQRLVRLMVRVLPLFGQDPAAMGRNKDVDFKRLVDVERTVTTKIHVAPWFEASLRASRCYASQMSGGDGRVFDLFRRWMYRYDLYTRIVPPFKDEQVERDLFAGIDEEPSTTRT
ncbi:MAG: PIG-L deacetylase family protein [Anaerolineae bacterium]